jgi:hypothetical protein
VQIRLAGDIVPPVVNSTTPIPSTQPATAQNAQPGIVSIEIVSLEEGVQAAPYVLFNRDTDNGNVLSGTNWGYYSSNFYNTLNQNPYKLVEGEIIQDFEWLGPVAGGDNELREIRLTASKVGRQSVSLILGAESGTFRLWTSKEKGLDNLISRGEYNIETNEMTVKLDSCFTGKGELSIWVEGVSITSNANVPTYMRLESTYASAAAPGQIRTEKSGNIKLTVIDLVHSGENPFLPVVNRTSAVDLARKTAFAGYRKFGLIGVDTLSDNFAINWDVNGDGKFGESELEKKLSGKTPERLAVNVAYSATSVASDVDVVVLDQIGLSRTVNLGFRVGDLQVLETIRLVEAPEGFPVNDWIVNRRIDFSKADKKVQDMMAAIDPLIALKMLKREEVAGNAHYDSAFKRVKEYTNINARSTDRSAYAITISLDSPYVTRRLEFRSFAVEITALETMVNTSSVRILDSALRHERRHVLQRYEMSQADVNLFWAGLGDRILSRSLFASNAELLSPFVESDASMNQFLDPAISAWEAVKVDYANVVKKWRPARSIYGDRTFRATDPLENQALDDVSVDDVELSVKVHFNGLYDSVFVVNEKYRELALKRFYYDFTTKNITMRTQTVRPFN